MTVEEIRKVVASKSYDTSVARAFREALGLPLEPSKHVGGEVTQAVRHASYKGIKECFKNYGSPLDYL